MTSPLYSLEVILMCKLYVYYACSYAKTKSQSVFNHESVTSSAPESALLCLSHPNSALLSRSFCHSQTLVLD
jgi:hypothetical protein